MDMLGGKIEEALVRRDSRTKSKSPFAESDARPFFIRMTEAPPMPGQEEMDKRGKKIYVPGLDSRYFIGNPSSKTFEIEDNGEIGSATLYWGRTRKGYSAVIRSLDWDIIRIASAKTLELIEMVVDRISDTISWDDLVSIREFVAY